MSKNSKIPTYDWVSVGGGAAGYFGAINFAIKRAENGISARVLILEAGSQVLSKVKISGGGRCNVTHHSFDPQDLVKNYPRGSKELLSVFSRFQPRDTIAWFESRGVSLKTEEDGRVFPVTDESQTIIRCFEQERKKLGIDLRVRAVVREIHEDEDMISLTLEGEDSVSARKVLIATGNNQRVWDMIEATGHSIVPPVPSLFSFNIEDGRLRDLSGQGFKEVEVKGDIERKVLSAVGPLLITHWGLSGPSVLALSSLLARELFEADYSFQIQINFLPNLDEKGVLAHLKEHQRLHAKRMLKNSSVVPFPGRYWNQLLGVLGFKPESVWADTSKEMFEKIRRQIQQATFEVSGKTTNKEEFVTAGGVELKEIDFRSMQSRHMSRLYFAGEVLNVDGLTGGFNFQNAWSTSFIAAHSAAEKN